MKFRLQHAVTSGRLFGLGGQEESLREISDGLRGLLSRALPMFYIYIMISTVASPGSAGN